MDETRCLIRGARLIIHKVPLKGGSQSGRSPVRICACLIGIYGASEKLSPRTGNCPTHKVLH